MLMTVSGEVQNGWNVCATHLHILLIRLAMKCNEHHNNHELSPRIQE